MENKDLSNLDKLRIIEIDILDEIVRICDKHNLKYFLAYGTLIGAVRHKGFIPWDDDIDIWMFREDYDKFAKICDTELGEKYYYQDWHKEKDYPYNFAKVRMNGTTVIQNGITKLNMHNGVYVDIFPLDKINSNTFIKDRKKINILKIIMGMRYQDFQDRGFIKNAVVRLIKIFIPKKWVHNSIDKINISNNNENCDKCGSKMSNIEAVFDLDAFEKCEIQFENRCYIVPAGYDIILSTIYGKYMELPPIEKQVSNHDNLILDFGDNF